jgi:hypothetical protein
VRKPKRKIPTPTPAEVSSYMGSLAKARWKPYRESIVRGEITAESYVYRPRGPMPPHSKAKQDLTRWENKIANARLIRLALEGRKLSAHKIELMAQTRLSRKRPRPHLRFGGQQPKQWHSMHYERLIKKAAAKDRDTPS